MCDREKCPHCRMRLAPEPTREELLEALELERERLPSYRRSPTKLPPKMQADRDSLSERQLYRFEEDLRNRKRG